MKGSVKKGRGMDCSRQKQGVVEAVVKEMQRKVDEGSEGGGGGVVGSLKKVQDEAGLGGIMKIRQG